ncbi:DUF1906 domain-containing protein [Caldibacillus thermolactis]|jgi:peptidoglycan hydrolase-like protein with peptidoglycan-binding domain|uniref:DUF1906 domain-containing protein n=1 Tax=Pallidibacillus thermolactis TaxID=251051 RepID=A0ABT2WJJ0_9BACI|nr:glycoside hydrolase domain-containing protein [Pallidibacillus thermolactis]MCU9595863.1 DUF1906 domain-containing protein [Pallidibacillus thermolactis]MED1674904.1 DUF1906 domain-containing protein [Pallidibacillus thermolactis subsp. kokeshiiformis]
MADERVRDVQRWLNETYSKYVGRYNSVEEDGRTGFRTVWALIRALQIELGIANTADNFGPTTEREFNNQIGVLRKQKEGDPPNNIIKILQGGFYCKGYNPGGFTGSFYSGTENAVKAFQRDIGIEADGGVTAKIFKALLNTDGYKLSSNYRAKGYIREIQQALNREYANYKGKKWFFDYIPTNGIYDRYTNKALIYALQIEEGLEDVANGNFGPSTISNCPVLRLGDSGPFVKILQWALSCNGEEFRILSMNGVFDEPTRNRVIEFQRFMALPVTGIAEVMTIKQLLTSNGLTSRTAVACDTSYIIDIPKAETLRQHGYEVVGRYLTGYVLRGGKRVPKALSQAELTTIFHSGLRVFLIYQDGGYTKEYFQKEGRGREDAHKALNAAWNLGIPSGETIYFAVDFDAMDHEVTQLILPYFREIKDVFLKYQTDSDYKDLPNYRIGVYGARNICTRVSEEALIDAFSFVADMSTGYSGNLGFPMPRNWSFDQFFEQPIGTGDGKLDIDKCGYSGLDEGVSRIDLSLVKSPEEIARRHKFVEFISKIPFLKEFKELFTPEFTFNQTWKLGPVAGVEATIETETSFDPSDREDGLSYFRVVDGSIIDVELDDLIAGTGLSLDVKEIVKDSLEGITQTINFGSIGFKANATNEIIEISLKIMEESIPVHFEGIEDVELAISLNLTIENNKGDGNKIIDPISDLTEVVVMIIAFLEIISKLLGLKDFPAFRPV